MDSGSEESFGRVCRFSSPDDIATRQDGTQRSTAFHLTHFAGTRNVISGNVPHCLKLDDDRCQVQESRLGPGISVSDLVRHRGTVDGNDPLDAADTSLRVKPGGQFVGFSTPIVSNDAPELLNAPAFQQTPERVPFRKFILIRHRKTLGGRRIWQSAREGCRGWRGSELSGSRLRSL